VWFNVEAHAERSPRSRGDGTAKRRPGLTGIHSVKARVIPPKALRWVELDGEPTFQSGRGSGGVNRAEPMNRNRFWLSSQVATASSTAPSRGKDCLGRFEKRSLVKDRVPAVGRARPDKGRNGTYRVDQDGQGEKEREGGTNRVRTSRATSARRTDAGSNHPATPMPWPVKAGRRVVAFLAMAFLRSKQPVWEGSVPMENHALFPFPSRERKR
jgi:hypothetical protein